MKCPPPVSPHCVCTLSAVENGGAQRRGAADTAAGEPAARTAAEDAGNSHGKELPLVTTVLFSSSTVHK
ncbi:hypothetical protein GN956_G17667 [Arapaima gigas]